MNEGPIATGKILKSETNYLERLPSWARQQGDADRGEIQLILESSSSDLKRCGIVYEDQYIAVVRDLVRFPSGDEGTYLRIFEYPTLHGSLAGIVILPTYERKIWLVRHYRHATREWELELPRGFCEPSFSVEENVRRETNEELGVAATAIRSLGQAAPNTGLLASFVGIWHVELASAPKVTDESRAEGIAGPLAMTPDDLKQAIRAGRIRDGFTLSAVALATAMELFG